MTASFFQAYCYDGKHLTTIWNDCIMGPTQVEGGKVENIERVYYRGFTVDVHEGVGLFWIGSLFLGTVELEADVVESVETRIDIYMGGCGDIL